MKTSTKQEKRYRRQKRVRAKIFGTKEKPRLCVFRSNKHISAQLIDDKKGYTLVVASDLEIKKPKIQDKKTVLEKDNKEDKRSGKVALAYQVGRLIAEKADKKKITKVVFDRGGYKYHGRV
ncbi:50S ribosomal protein L18, partial [Parcubacteria bacterium DG_74_3]